MLDLSYLHDAHHDHDAVVVSQSPEIICMNATDLAPEGLEQDWLSNLKQLAKRTVQTCRLIVGIHDYEYYLAHMHSKHPEAKPYSRDEFYRYCLEARFPSANSKGTRCPC
jgi:uncharacterized short protein YbdD (DUF466 family)